MYAFDTDVPATPFAGRSVFFILLGAAVFSQAALGAFVRHSDAGLACPDFPACLGGIIPPVLDGKVLAHFSHRLVGYLLLLTALALYASTAVDPRMRPNRGRAAGLLGLVLLQIMVGGWVVMSGLYYGATAVHLAVALAIIMMLASMWVSEAEGAVAR